MPTGKPMKTFILSMFALTLLLGTSDARKSPYAVDWGAAPARAPSSVDPDFDCGTYKGIQRESLRHYHNYMNTKNKIALGKVSPTAAVDFIYEDVWIVEDDGTLAQSGVNLFDTPNRSFRFTPNAGGYDVTSITYSYDGVLGADLGLGDDQNVTVPLLFTFTFYGTGYTDVHITSNGMAGFGADAQAGGFFDSNDFYSSVPKIAPYAMDLDPSAFGSVHHKSEATKSTVTWFNIPEWGTATSNTIQLVLYNTGVFEVTFNTIQTVVGGGYPITFGLTPGGGSPTLEEISYSGDLPYSGGSGNGIFEAYLNIVNPAVNEVALMQKFYENFSDDYFQIVFFTNFQQTMGGFANELNISNDVTGIGLGVFDNSALYGSSSVLESRCNMNQLSVWPADPTNRFFGSSQNNFLTIMGQEAGHRWGAFIHFEDSDGFESNLILGRADAHWSYYVDVDHSSLEGGNWEPLGGGVFITNTVIDYFSDVDEYTFGTRLPEEVTDFFYVDSFTNNLLQNRDAGTPAPGAIASGTAVTVTINDVIAQEGARTPTEPNENKDLRMAFIVLTANGVPLTQVQLDKIALFRQSWEDYFEVSVDGRFAVNTSITETPPIGVIKGIVRDGDTGLPVADFTATSVERGFVQFVTAGGRYIFRYQAPIPSPSDELVTIVYSAPGYYSETKQWRVVYGTNPCEDVTLYKVSTGAPEPKLSSTALHQNYPNPFNPNTTIAYNLKEATQVRLNVFTVTGRLVRTLVNRVQAAGPQSEMWDGLNNAGVSVSSGVYVCQLQAGGFVASRKMILMK